jgi:putative Mg2+ transporter-C (MgtC) family protein
MLAPLMPLHPDWPEIVIRLVLTGIAGALIGLNRGEHNRPVGLRTTMLVAYAAAISMIQVNLLLPQAGKPENSFVTLDLMRLPLGILSGMGFIGAGAILRRGDLVQGVTTAATLWFVTVMGLCFGGGQNLLGLAAAGLGLFILWVLRWVEARFPREHQAEFMLLFETGGTIGDEAAALLAAARCRVAAQAVSFEDQGRRCMIRYDVRWRARETSPPIPDFFPRLARQPTVLKAEWRPVGAG